MLERIHNALKLENNANPNKIVLKNEFERIIKIDQKVNRNFFLIVRQLRALIQDAQLRKRLKIETLKIMDYRLISHLLENIGDNCASICENILDSIGQINKMIENLHEGKKDIIFNALLEISEKVEKFHKATFDAFIHADSEKAAQLIYSYGSLSEFDRYIQECKTRQQRSNLLLIFNRYYDIHDMLRDICDLIQP